MKEHLHFHSDTENYVEDEYIKNISIHSNQPHLFDDYPIFKNRINKKRYQSSSTIRKLKRQIKRAKRIRVLNDAKNLKNNNLINIVYPVPKNSYMNDTVEDLDNFDNFDKFEKQSFFSLISSRISMSTSASKCKHKMFLEEELINTDRNMSNNDNTSLKIDNTNNNQDCVYRQPKNMEDELGNDFTNLLKIA